MNGIKVVALAFVALGVASLVYGGFTYTRDKSTTDLGVVEITVTDRERVNVPVWAGVGAVVLGTLLLIVPARKG